MKTGGTDTASGMFQYCFYDGSDGTARVAWGALSAMQGTAADYISGCTDQTPGFPVGQLVTGVGAWACYVPASTPGDPNGFSVGNNGKYVIVMSGDAPLDKLKQVATAFLAKLPP